MINETRTEWRCQRNLARGAVEMIGFQKPVGSTLRLISAELTVTEHEPGAYIGEPTFSFSDDEAQQIMDELWRAGIRPNNGSGGIAHAEAMQSHLDDMRRLAFHALKVPVEKEQ